MDKGWTMVEFEENSTSEEDSELDASEDAIVEELRRPALNLKVWFSWGDSER